MDTVDSSSSYPTCRVWSYDSTDFTGELCAANSEALAALLPNFQT